MTLPIWLDERASGEEILDEVDVAIIGGGIVGASCAYLLRHSDATKDLKVALFESRGIASGSTGRNAGFVLRGIQAYYNHAVKLYGREIAREVFRFAEENQRQIKVFAESIADEKGLDFELSNCGSYLLACSLDELDDLKQSAKLMQEDGFSCEFLVEDPIDRDFYGALFNPGDFAINPVKLTRALLARSSASVFENEEVFSVKKSASGGKLVVSTQKRSLTAGKVLLATNAYAPLGSYALSEKLNIIRGQILVTKPLKKRLELMESICYANYGFEYFRQLPDNRMLLGGCRQQFMDEERGFGDTVTRPVQAALESYLKHRFPECAGIPVDYRFSGLMAFTNDGLPLIGEHEGLPGVFCAVGCNGHGLGFGMNLARMLINVALMGASAGSFCVQRDSLKKPAAMAFSVEKGP
ncbi:MAG: FAD-binding oxidoreductase [Candidatus Melainabacteria bacterium]|jgi:glycine/D-amino acid oxidase-like deaminating enzyme|nr:FAD-binding oxidoreductase [Candidatus Melainabacteria bacterium]